MSVSAENFEKAVAIHQALQSDEMFEHCGKDSRGIDFQAEPFIEDLVRMALKFEGTELENFIYDIGGLIQVVASDYGGYIRTKGSDKFLNIEIRGCVGPVSDDPSLRELSMIAMHRSAISIDISENKTSIYFHTNFLLYPDGSGRDFDDVMTDRMKSFNDQEKSLLSQGLLEIVAKHVQLSGEFTKPL